MFARRGLVPEAGSAWFLPQLVGLSQALRWCLSGRVFDAEEALKGGLVSEVTAPENLLARAREIAMEIAETTAPVSIALTRQMLWRFAGAPDPFGLLQIDGALRDDAGRRRRREGRRRRLPRKAPAELPRPRQRRHAGRLPLVGGAQAGVRRRASDLACRRADRTG